METKTKYCILIGLTTNKGENLNQAEIDGIMHNAAVTLGNFSVIEQMGFWQGGQEKSLCIVHIGTESESEIKVEKLAVYLQRNFEQDSVYITKENIWVTDINSEYVPRETYNSKVTR